MHLPFSDILIDVIYQSVVFFLYAKSDYVVGHRTACSGRGVVCIRG